MRTRRIIIILIMVLGTVFIVSACAQPVPVTSEAPEPIPTPIPPAALEPSPEVEAPEPEPIPTPSTVPTTTILTWIDSHVHLNPDACEGDLCGVDLLVSGMDDAGISKAVLFPLRGVSDSAAVLDAYHKYPDRIIPFRGPDWVEIDDQTTLDMIRADLDTGLFRGLGEIATRHGVYGINNPSDHPLMLDLWELASEYDIPVTIHMGGRPLGEDVFDLPSEWLPEFERALEQCESTTFIWAHTGPVPPNVLKEMLDRHSNLYADLSGLNPVFHEMRGYYRPELFIDGPEWIGLLEAYPDRFLFGTDVFFAEGYSGLPSLINYFKDEIFPQLSPETAEVIAHRNAERLFGKASPQ